MWWAGSEGWDLYIGTRHMGVSRGGELLTWVPCNGWREAIEAGFVALVERRGPSRWRRTRVRVWMSTLLAQPFRLEAVQGLTRWSEVRAYAEARARDAVGLSGERAGRCVVAVGDWSDKWPSTAVAMSLEVRDALYAAASAHRCAIDAIRPWWAQAAAELAAESSESALIALSDNDGLVLLADREERFTATCYAPLPEPAECDRLLSRVAITGGDGVAMRRYRLDPQSRSGKRGCFAWVEDAPQ